MIRLGGLIGLVRLLAVGWAVLLTCATRIVAAHGTPDLADVLRAKFASDLEASARQADGVVGYVVVDVESGERFARLDGTQFPDGVDDQARDPVRAAEAGRRAAYQPRRRDAARPQTCRAWRPALRAHQPVAVATRPGGRDDPAKRQHRHQRAHRARRHGGGEPANGRTGPCPHQIAAADDRPRRSAPRRGERLDPRRPGAPGHGVPSRGGPVGHPPGPSRSRSCRNTSGRPSVPACLPGWRSQARAASWKASASTPASSTSRAGLYIFVAMGTFLPVDAEPSSALDHLARLSYEVLQPPGHRERVVRQADQE